MLTRVLLFWIYVNIHIGGENMSNYTDAILWYASWSILIWLSYKFVMLNIKHHGKMERLEELEKIHGSKK